MIWQLIAIWLIVGITLALFVHSERRRRDEALVRQAREFATSPAYRHRSVEPTLPRALVPAGLSAADRLFIETLAEMSRRKT